MLHSEFGLSVGFEVTAWLRLSLGYNFLYWSNVARVGSSMDRTVNPTLLPASAAAFAILPSGPPPSPSASTRPAFAFHDTDYWAQGLGFTLQILY